MDQNRFMIYNNMLYALYNTHDVKSLSSTLLFYLRMLIPCKYSSVLTQDPDTIELNFKDVLTLPQEFKEAEELYMKLSTEDDTEWLMHVHESTVIKESDMVSEDSRLHSNIYHQCYEAYHIYDSLQVAITYNEQFKAVITLFHTFDDPEFTDQDIALLKALSLHLGYLWNRVQEPQDRSSETTLQLVSNIATFTNREKEVMKLVFDGMVNLDITERLNITEHTLQKHLQNIYRKLNITSRIELLRYRL